MQNADHILIPLLNGAFGLAQIAQTQDQRVLLYVSDRLATPKTKVTPLAGDEIVAFVFADVAALPDAHWPVIGYDAVPRLHSAPEHQSWDLMGEDFACHDPAVIEAFVNALNGLYPWDGFPDPDFFTKMLRDPAAVPETARMTSDLPKPESPA